MKSAHQIASDIVDAIPLKLGTTSAQKAVLTVVIAEELIKQTTDLQKFTKKMFELSDWPEGGDIDGFSFQEAAVECGLLIPELQTKPCSENCHCATYNGDMSDGVICYRKVGFLTETT